MLHHLDLNVSDFDRSTAFYAALMPRLGYTPGEAGQGWLNSEGDLTLLKAMRSSRA